MLEKGRSRALCRERYSEEVDFHESIVHNFDYPGGVQVVKECGIRKECREGLPEGMTTKGRERVVEEKEERLRRRKEEDAKAVKAS